MQLTRHEIGILQDSVLATTHACAVCRETCGIRFTKASVACPSVVALETLKVQVADMGDTGMRRT